MNPENTADIVIMTALLKEHEAVLRHLEDLDEVKGPLRAVRARLRNSQRKIISLCVGEMGNISSATATIQAIDVWRPSNIIMCGITGGVKSGTNRYLGDVVVAEQIVDYELGKLEPGSFIPRYQVYRPSKPLLDAAKALSPTDWIHTITTPRPDGTTGRVVPVAHFGVLASGNKVVKDPDFVQDLTEDWTQLIALEMESAGLAAAAYRSGTAPGILLVKAICDWADPEKADTWQGYAGDASAAFVAAILRKAALPETREQPVRVTIPTLSGRMKLEVCKRLGTDWMDLADYFDIPPMKRRAFTPGREPQGVWEYLQDRQQLGALKEALAHIDRSDLVLVLEG